MTKKWNLNFRGVVKSDSIIMVMITNIVIT